MRQTCGLMWTCQACSSVWKKYTWGPRYWNVPFFFFFFSGYFHYSWFPVFFFFFSLFSYTSVQPKFVYFRLPQIAAQVPHVALRTCFCGTWKVLKNKGNNKKYVMRSGLGKPAKCHTWQFCRNKQNNLKIVMFSFIFFITFDNR